MDIQRQRLAAGLGVSRQTVNAIEWEKYDPSLPLAFKISDIFDLAIEEIFVPDGRRVPVRQPAVRQPARR